MAYDHLLHRDRKVTDAPGGLTVDEYVALAKDCLDQAGLSALGQQKLQEIIEIDIDADLLMTKEERRALDLDQARAEINAGTR